MTETTNFSEQDQEKKRLTTIVYALQALGFLLVRSRCDPSFGGLPR